MVSVLFKERGHSRQERFVFAYLRRVESDFLGSPVVKTPWFHCRGLGLDPWSGN